MARLAAEGRLTGTVLRGLGRERSGPASPASSSSLFRPGVEAGFDLFGAAACRPDRHPRAGLTAEVFPGAGHRVRMGGDGPLASHHLATLTRWIGHHTPMTPTS
ncbi:hypothetical protein GCM10018953_30830 [Streptosporangium nondiastaticum]